MENNKNLFLIEKSKDEFLEIAGCKYVTTLNLVERDSEVFKNRVSEKYLEFKNSNIINEVNKYNSQSIQGIIPLENGVLSNPKTKVRKQYKCVLEDEKIPYGIIYGYNTEKLYINEVDIKIEDAEGISNIKDGKPKKVTFTIQILYNGDVIKEVL